MEETALQYCQRLIELITLGDKDISIKSRLIHLKNKIEDESRPVQVGVMLQNAGHGRTIKILQDSLHEKNLALDAMGFVWCDGGCEGGIYRYNNKELTEEILKKAEQNVKRMRTWFENNRYKKGILST